MSQGWAFEGTVFEGSEKKLEITFSTKDGSKLESLRYLPRAFWGSVVEATGARILSELSTLEVDAYLLSESSLFVFRDRILMITCGQTRLIEAAKKVIEKVGIEQVNALFFERKNEAFPQAQLSTFENDVETLKHWFDDGQIHHIEYEAVGGYIRLFHWCKTAPSPEQARTFELLMHDLDPKVLAALRDTSKTNRAKWSRLFHFNSIFPNFLVDEFWFDPCGYSLNALSGREYFTIHITPEEEASYVSLETNHAFANEREFRKAIQTVLNAFKPQISLLVQFHHESREIFRCETLPSFDVSETKELDLPPGVIFSFNAIRGTEALTSPLYPRPVKRNSVWINP